MQKKSPKEFNLFGDVRNEFHKSVVANQAVVNGQFLTVSRTGIISEIIYLLIVELMQVHFQLKSR
jgi:hypothetical protein